MKRNKALYLTRGAVIAALYFILTLLSAAFGLDKGIIQLRFSEALVILPALFPEAVPGLALGCLISNLFTGAVIWDTVFGTLATLIAALATRVLWCTVVSKKQRALAFLLPLPAVILNALIIPFILIYAYGASGSYFIFLLSVFIGEFICAEIFGILLYFYLKKSFDKFI